MTPEELLHAIFGEQPEDGPCECVCAECLNGYHCDRASCVQPA